MNFRLSAGIILLIPVLAAAFFGPLLAPYDKKYTEPVRFTEVDGHKEFIAPPSAPSTEHLLGTDKGGRDLLSIILYGARWTVGTTFILAFLKLIIGGVLGIAAVFRKKHKKRNPGLTALNALPQIVFIYFMLAIISINFPFNEMILVSVFGIIILVFGTPASAAAIEAAAGELTKKEFFAAAVSTGAGRPYLVIHHILPFLKERFLALFISEIISVLNTIGQMGIFGIFLGATVMTFDPVILNSRLHEWAGLVGQARFYIYNEQWILFGPLGAYMIYLLSLYLIMEGLKKRYRKNYRT